MIAFIEGEIAFLEEEAVVLNVAGIGYRVNTPIGVIGTLQIGDWKRLYTYQHVREDALILFGFLQDTERRLFLRLQSATGVGPKLALQMFHHLSAGQIIQALRLDDTHTLSRVPGIGAKTASRMSLELKDRLDDLGAWPQEAETSTTRSRMTGKQVGTSIPEGLVDIQAALAALGYNEREIAHILTVDAEEFLALEAGDALKRALRLLSR